MCDNSSILKKTNWKPKVSFNQGLKDTIMDKKIKGD